MKKIIKRLKSRAGESLVESMAAILVFTLASIIMLSMVSTSANINETAKASDQKLAEELAVAEKGTGTSITLGATVTIDFLGSSQESVSVDLYRKDDAALYAYYVQAPEEAEMGGGT